VLVLIEIEITKALIIEGLIWSGIGGIIVLMILDLKHKK
jgi:hypothetical protein